MPRQELARARRALSTHRRSVATGDGAFGTGTYLNGSSAARPAHQPVTAIGDCDAAEAALRYRTGSDFRLCCSRTSRYRRPFRARIARNIDSYPSGPPQSSGGPVLAPAVHRPPTCQTSHVDPCQAAAGWAAGWW